MRAQQRSPEVVTSELDSTEARPTPISIEQLEHICDAATRCVAVFDESPCAGNTSAEAVQAWGARASEALSALRLALRDERALGAALVGVRRAGTAPAEPGTPVPVHDQTTGVLLPIAPPLSGGLCVRCGQYLLHRSRSWTRRERLASSLTPFRLYRCHGCRWRGWLLRRPRMAPRPPA